MFIPLGWDKDETTKRKHYRRYYPQELETVEEVMGKNPSPFNTYNVMRGQTRGAKASWWKRITNQYKTDGSGQVDTTKKVGKFKAIIEVESKTARAEYFEEKNKLIDELATGLKDLAKNRGIKDFNLDIDKLATQEGRMEMRKSMEPLNVNHLGVIKKLASIQSDVILKNLLKVPERQIVRFYAVSGYNFASRDMGGFSDPYLKIKLGNKIVSDRENYQLDNPAPTFYKHWDFEAVFPGCPLFTVYAMDHDLLFGDDLIGSTDVDLEDRFFLAEWRAIR